MKRLSLLVFGLLLLLVLSVDSRTTTLAVGAREHTTMVGLPHDIYLIRVHPNSMWYYRYTYNQKDISKLYTLSGPNIWVGYENDGWNTPGESTWESYIELYSRSRPNQPYYLWIASAPSNRTQTKYLFLYSSLKAWCDSKGQHCGQHDWVFDSSSGVKLATTFAVTANDIFAIYRSVGYYSLGR